MAKKQFQKPLSDAFLAKAANVSVASQSGDEIERVPVNKIKASPFQARKQFDEQKIDELKDSIAQHGIIEPLVGRSEINGTYTLIAGERRLRAAIKAGLTDVPMVLLEVTDEELLELGLTENIQRQNLHPVDELHACIKLIQLKGNQKDAAKVLGLAPSTFSGIVRAFSLGNEVLEVCEKIPNLSRRSLRNLVELKESERLTAAQKLLQITNSENDQKPVIRPTSHKPLNRGNTFKFVGKAHGNKQFNVVVKYRKQGATNEDIQEALLLSLAENVKEGSPELQNISSDQIQAVIKNALAQLSGVTQKD